MNVVSESIIDHLKLLMEPHPGSLHKFGLVSNAVGSYSDSI